MSWLDGFLAVPVVGFQIRPNFQNIFNYQNIVAPFVNEIHQTYGSVVIDEQGINKLFIRSNETGFSYEFQPENIVIKFTYIAVQEKKAGVFPENVKKMKIQAYSKLLENTALEAKKVLRLFTSGNEVFVKRVGIVAALNADRHSLPPGIEILLQHLAKPWGSSLIRCNAMLTPSIGKTDLFEDRCHHSIAFDEQEKPDEIDISFDWQRIFEKEEKASPKSFERQIDLCCQEALKYFEIVGSGDLDYE